MAMVKRVGPRTPKTDFREKSISAPVFRHPFCIDEGHPAVPQEKEPEAQHAIRYASNQQSKNVFGDPQRR